MLQSWYQVRDYTNESYKEFTNFRYTLHTLRYNFPGTCARGKCAAHWAQQILKRGDVSELADEHDLGSCAARREGSIPSVPTLFHHPNPLQVGEGAYPGEEQIENRKSY